MVQDWITPGGFLDLAKFPIDGVLRQALDQDDESFRGACTVLDSMACHGRREAGIFLLGLLSFHRDDLARLAHVVHALRGFDTPEAVDALIGELRRVPSKASTRTYRSEVFEALTRLPNELVHDQLVELSADRSFSPKWRRKFEEALWDIDGRPTRDDDYW